MKDVIKQKEDKMYHFKPMELSCLKILAKSEDEAVREANHHFNNILEVDNVRKLTKSEVKIFEKFKIAKLEAIKKRRIIKRRKGD